VVTFVYLAALRGTAIDRKIARMSRDLIVVHSRLSVDECQNRISSAASGDVNKVIGYALSSQVDVVDGADCFELRNRLAPVVFKGTVSATNSNGGSVITGQIEVPGQRWYRVLFAFIATIGLFVLGASGWDLAFGTHLLLTRSRTELGPGHPATPEQHWLAFVLIPLVTVPMVAMLWRKACGASKEARQTMNDCLQRLFGGTC
jgi:hypothetical protein